MAKTGLPGVLIETPRLTIRTFQPEDFAQFRALFSLYPGWRLQKDDEAGFFSWHLSNYEAMDIERGYVCLGVFLKVSGTLIGNVGVNNHDALHVPELGYGILEAYRGKGYAKETAAAALAWAGPYFSLASIVATAETGNFASCRVLEACGFRREDTRRLFVSILGESFDFAVYRYTY